MEILESKFGIKITEYRLHTDNTGAGEFRGGYGLILGHEALNDDMDFGGAYGRHERPAWGLPGGTQVPPTGLISSGWMAPTTAPTAAATASPEEGGHRPHGHRHRRRLRQPPGGTPARVAMDVKNEYITLERAREIYGVEVDPATFAVVGATQARKDFQAAQA